MTAGVSAARRVVLAVALVVAAFGLSAPWAGTVPATNDQPEGSTAAVQRVDALAQVGPAGRPAATPALVRIASPAEPVPFAVVAQVAPAPVLARLGLDHRAPVPARYPAQRPAAGDRAPPSGNRIS